MRTLTVTYDYTHPRNNSYYRMVSTIQNGEDNAYTADINFASFDMLRFFDEVIVHSAEHGWIYLTELLSNGGFNYTLKDMRKVHNVPKMLRAGSFNWRKEQL